MRSVLVGEAALCMGLFVLALLLSSVVFAAAMAVVEVALVGLIVSHGRSR